MRPALSEQRTDRLQRLPQALGEFDGSFLARVRKQHDELFAADTGEHVAFSQALLDGAGRRDENPVAGRMAVRVVHLLEVVEVEQGERQRRSVPVRALDLVRQRFFECAPVRE